ncbi:NAD(P)-dependent dehydrogenase (short-subunit alcohol dehydrogenase family) [Marmoricola sp. OAE513]|uniref:SDR family NAD(P)-dependent oxidoreductase n=1 Tax=Marmoricola sp. OAE513 TaxID=2817894 RepID=UPI00339B1002
MTDASTGAGPGTGAAGAGRVVLVTGASSGIGRETALQLAARGDSLVLLARRTAELEVLRRACLRTGSPEALVITADVSDADAIEEAFTTASAEIGPVDTVVHAAGVAAYGRFEEIPAASFDRLFDINVGGTANVARSALRHFDAHELTGNLILFGSVVGRISTPYLSPYVASKWAVHGLVRCLQAEQARGGHRVSLVEPGGVDTTIYEKAASYLGVQGKPPPPVDDAEKVARATVALLDHPPPGALGRSTEPGHVPRLPGLPRRLRPDRRTADVPARSR